ncbi:MAG TPA: VOC family protein [Acidimicrobiales bacterium]
MPTRPSRPSVNHLVLNVRDIEASQRFYCDVLGFEQCGTLKVPFEPSPVMRFYRGHPDHHHDLALVQLPDPASAPPAPAWNMFTNHPGLAHLALAYGTRDEWLAQLEHLRAMDVPIVIRGNHGMTHSAYIVDPDGHGIEVLYEVPAEAWEGDVDAALSYFELLPNEGPDSLEDSTDYVRFGPVR